MGRTPGSSSEQSSLAWGTQYMGGTSVGGIFSGGTTTISIDLNLEGIDASPYGKQYWFKILDVVTNSFIIENIYIHEYEFYGRCVPTPTPTATPTATSTPTPTSTPTSTPTVTPTSTPTITPTVTLDCNFTISVVDATITPTPTPTSTPTSTSTGVDPTETPTPTPTSTPTYGISVSPTEAGDAGGAYGATVTATNISFPQTFYITILSTVGTVNSSDFQMDFPSTITLSSSGQEYFFSLAEDQLTEGTEKFRLELRSGSSSGPILATSNEVTILDTSLSLYYYTLVPCAGGSNSYSNGQPQGTFDSGDIVEGATETYYVIGGSTTTDPGGVKITVTASILTECPSVPTPTPDPGQIILIHTGQTFFNTTEPCAMTQFQIATNGGNVYLNGTNVPANGLYAYNTAACLVGDEYVGNSNYYACIANSIKYAFTIGDGGFINNVTVC